MKILMDTIGMMMKTVDFVRLSENLGWVLMRYLIIAALVLCSASSGCKPQDTNKIESLTPKEAAELVTTALKPGNDNYLMPLNGLTSIDKDVARELAKCWRSLSFDGLTSIDKDVAQELAKSKASLYLDGLTSIDKDVAKELAKFERKYLSLDGLTSIDKDVAQELAKFEGDCLLLRGLNSIDLGTAVALAKCKSELILIGVNNFYEPSIARALSYYSGPRLVLDEYKLEKDTDRYPLKARDLLIWGNRRVDIKRVPNSSSVNTSPVKKDINKQINEQMGIIYAVVILGLPIYCLPWIVATTKKKKQTTAIAVLNLLLGWTFLGWVIALVWAAMED